MKSYIKISTYAKLMNISKKTAYIHFHSGKIKGYQDKSTGTIYVENTFSSVDEVKTVKNPNEVILYARVSSSQNKDNLDSQLDRLRSYAYAKGYIVIDEVKEVASGLNDNRKQLTKILNRNDYTKVIVEHKDRLTRFGFNYIEQFLNYKDQSIEVINMTDGDKKDLIEDFVSIITSFCARIYGQRRTRRKTEHIIKELTNESD